MVDVVMSGPRATRGRPTANDDAIPRAIIPVADPSTIYPAKGGPPKTLPPPPLKPYKDDDTNPSAWTVCSTNRKTSTPLCHNRKRALASHPRQQPNPTTMMAPPTPTPIPIPIPSATSASAPSATDDDADPFSHPQNLESTYYDEGFTLGRADGARAGRIEGRVFGLEKGFDKFFTMGALAGRAGVWGARLGEDDEPAAAAAASKSMKKREKGQRQRLIGLPPRARLRTHVHALHALAEAASLETRNTEDGVADFDDRLRRAQAKLKVIEGLVGERGGGREAEDDGVEAQAERSGGEELEVEVTMGHVEVRLEEERERERRDKEKGKESKPASTAVSGGSASSDSGGAKKPPRAPKRAGFKVAGGARHGKKNMEDFGIGDARALGRLI